MAGAAGGGTNAGSATAPVGDRDEPDVGDRARSAPVTVRAAGERSDFRCNLRAPIVVWNGRGHQVINEAPDAPVRATLPEAEAAHAA